MSCTIESVYFGKKARYRFNPKGLRISENTSFSFSAPDWKRCDTSRYGYSFSVPEQRKDLRNKVRRKSEAYRFAALNAGFWIRPRNRNEGIEKAFFDNRMDVWGTVVIVHFISEPSIEQIGWLWDLRGKKTYFLFGIGTNFKKLKYPLLRYTILHG